MTQVHAMGIRSLAPTVVAGLFAGMVVALQGAHELARFGASLYIGPAVARSIAREAGPLMVALLVGGKVGAGITAALGAMRVTEQVDALRAIGGNYLKLLVTSRLLAGSIVYLRPLSPPPGSESRGTGGRQRPRRRRVLERRSRSTRLPPAEAS